MELVDIPLKYFLSAFAVWLVSFVWLAKRPEWIGALVLVFMFFIPLLVDSVLAGTHIPVGQIIVLFFFPPLLVSLVLKQARIVWNDLLLLAGYGSCILASIVFNDLSLWGRKAALVPLVFTALIYLSIDSRRALHRLLFVYVVLVALNAVFAGLQQAGYEWAYPAGDRDRAVAGGYQRGFGIVGNFTQASLYATVTIPIAIAMFIRSTAVLTTLLSFVLGIVGITAQIFSVSRSGVLGIVLGSWVVLNRGINLRALVAGFVALALAAVIVVGHPLTRQSGTDLFNHLSVFFSEDAELDRSAASRPLLARLGLDTWSDSRVIGGGPFAVHRDHDRDPHNTLINVLAQYGIVGLLFFLLVLYRCYRNTVRAADKGYRTEGAALGGALVATLPIAFFHSLDYVDLFWFVPGLCLALARFPSLEEAAESGPETALAPQYVLVR